jgi:hypothetical protein
MENGWKMEMESSPLCVARKPWRGSPSGPSEESADPTLPTSGLLASNSSLEVKGQNDRWCLDNPAAFVRLETAFRSVQDSTCDPHLRLDASDHTVLFR